jgi:hypothetical protein
MDAAASPRVSATTTPPQGQPRTIWVDTCWCVVVHIQASSMYTQMHTTCEVKHTPASTPRNPKEASAHLCGLQNWQLLPWRTL